MFTFNKSTRTWIAEFSSLITSAPLCPDCHEPILRCHETGRDMDQNGEDVMGFHYTHSCGANIVIIND